MSPTFANSRPPRLTASLSFLEYVPSVKYSNLAAFFISGFYMSAKNRSRWLSFWSVSV